ncbi:MAG: beta-lactamase family protein [Pyrinomonadaceae bacterium]|nr:beta-lactamase family protein [Pyrinomonadaceae bacterium]
MNLNDLRTTLSFLVLFAFLTLSVPQVGYSQSPAARTESGSDLSAQLAAIEAKVEARRKELGIPGMSLAIVKDDKVIYLKGLGLKDFEKKIAVTPDTQFAIGSATKAFTALSVLMSQDQGKLSLDDSPKKYLPYFKMFDPEADKNILIRDLLSHSSGLNRTDLAMITGRLNRSELIQVAAQAKPTAKLREKFQYQNIMFAAAGEIVALVQKTPWEKFIPEQIFKPLGMNNSTMSMKQMQKAKDYSFGYEYNFDTKATERKPFREIDQVAPAGSINSSARDMAEWLRFVINGGSVGGKRLVSEKSYEEWLKPQMKIAGTTSYGFGWFLQDWNGLKVVQHGGNIDGFNSMVAMIPERKIGFVMLTNVSGSSLGNELMQIVWENLIGAPKVDESAKLPVKTMERMVGKYRLAAANMDFEVKIVGDELVMVVPGQPEYKLQRTAPRQFKMVGAPDGFAVKFNPEQGDATELYLQQPQGNYTLPRINPDGSLAKSSEPASASTGSATELVGRYTVPGGGVEVNITESGGKVTFNIPGQQPYSLGEKSKDVYSLSPLPDTYFLTAKRDPAGKITSVAVTQPEGVFDFKRIDAGSEPAMTMTAEELMQRTVEAAGGEVALRKISSRYTEADVDFENQGVQGKSISWSKAPDRTATEMTMIALGKTIATGWEYFDGKVGEEIYSFAPADKYTGKRLEDVALAANFYAPLEWKSLYKKITIRSRAKVGDEECYVVDFEPNKGSNFTEYYSTKTFLLRKRTGVISSSTSEQKTPYSVTFDDYRAVDGIMLPFKIASFNPGNGNIVTVVKAYKHNITISDDLFKPKKVK